MSLSLRERASAFAVCEGSESVELTKEQIETVKHGDAVRIAANEVGEEVVILRSDVYDRWAELLDDWDPRLMRRQMAKMMQDEWGDPQMGVYDR